MRRDETRRIDGQLIDYLMLHEHGIREELVAKFTRQVGDAVVTGWSGRAVSWAIGSTVVIMSRALMHQRPGLPSWFNNRRRWILTITRLMFVFVLHLHVSITHRAFLCSWAAIVQVFFEFVEWKRELTKETRGHSFLTQLSLKSPKKSSRHWF